MYIVQRDFLITLEIEELSYDINRSVFKALYSAWCFNILSK
jgi:hypothetical protein